MKNALHVEDQEDYKSPKRIPAIWLKSLSNQAVFRRVDALTVSTTKTSRVATTLDNSPAGTSDAGGLHTARVETNESEGREDAQSTAHSPRHGMNQKKAQIVIAMKRLFARPYSMNGVFRTRASPTVRYFRTLLTVQKTTLQV